MYDRNIFRHGSGHGVDGRELPNAECSDKRRDALDSRIAVRRISYINASASLEVLSLMHSRPAPEGRTR